MKKCIAEPASGGVRRRNGQIALFVLLLLCYLPFIGKAVHIDDPLFIWTARQIQSHPLDFFGFNVNWYGFEQPIADITKNPPLFSYYLALTALLVGWSEPALHLAAFIPLLALARGTWLLAGRLHADPFLASLATISTPVFLLTGTTLMCDVTMTAFWVWGVLFWVQGLSAEGKKRDLLAAALCVAGAGLSKYFGMALLPLLLLYAICKKMPPLRWLPFLLLSGLIFMAYQRVTGQMYGTGLISEAARYSLSVRHLTAGTIGESLLVGFSFAGGGVLIPYAAAPLLLRRKGWLIGGSVLLLLCLILRSAGTVSGFVLSAYPGLLLQTACFALAGLGILALPLADLREKRDADSLLLLCWVFGTFIFAALLNWTVSGRNMLPLAPAAGILLSRRFSSAGISDNPVMLRRAVFLLLPILAVSLLVTAADYRWGGEVRRMAGRVAELRSAPADLWFQGHWGFQYYLEQAGGKAVDLASWRPAAGDLLVSPSFGTNIRRLESDRSEPVTTLETAPLPLLATINARRGTFFYSSKGGPLPFAFGEVLPDSYRVERMQVKPLMPPGGSSPP